MRKKHEKLPFTENSTQIEVKLELFRMEYVRERVKRTCDCPEAGNRFVTAPQPPQAIEKSKFSHNMLAFLVVLKYLFAIPLQRMLNIMGMQGAEISPRIHYGCVQKADAFTKAPVRFVGNRQPAGQAVEY
jgi:hypothetical protein